MLLCSLSLLLPVSSLAQEPAPVQLRFDGALRAGELIQARVSSPIVGAPAWLIVGPAGNFELFGSDQPTLGVQPFGAGQFFRGKIAANGQYAPRFQVPMGAFAAGQRLAWQAAVRDQTGRFHVSPRVDLVGEGQETAVWADGSASLPQAVRGQATSIPQAADFDRDGDLDIIVLAETEVVYLRNDAGQFSEDSANRFPAELGYTTDFAIADFDENGTLDLVFVGRRDLAGQWQNPLVVLNSGTGHFTAATELPSFLEAGSRVTVGDVEGDGDADILLTIGGQHSGGGSSVQSLALFLNRGGAQSGLRGEFFEDYTFALDTSFNHDHYTVTDAQFADVDQDGDLDLFVSKTGSQGGENDLLLNNGSGIYRTVGQQQLPGFSDKSGQAQFDDFNGDGYLDVFVCNSHWTIDPEDSGDLLINRGAAAPGYFDDADATHFPDQFDDNLTIRNYAVSDDIDGDGDRDLIVLPHEFMGSQGGLVGHPTLFLNQGNAQGGRTGSFIEDPNFWIAGATFVAGGGLLADLDGDGDRDFYASSIGGVLAANKVQDYLLINQLF
jgi:hypothetical protein